MKQLLQLIDVKSLVTLAMTGAMIALLFAPVDPNPEAQSLFCTAYGAIITYFFTISTVMLCVVTTQKPCYFNFKFIFFIIPFFHYTISIIIIFKATPHKICAMLP